MNAINKISVHYKAQKIVMINASLILTMLFLLNAILFGVKTTYHKFLSSPEGKPILIIIFITIACMAIWRLPYFVRSLFRIPALEYNGHKLTIRGWDTYQILSEDLPKTTAQYGDGEFIILKTPRQVKPIIIDLRLVWKVSAVSLIEDLTLRPIARSGKAPDE